MRVKDYTDQHEDFAKFVEGLLAHSSLADVCQLCPSTYITDFARNEEFVLIVDQPVLWESELAFLKAQLYALDIGMEPVYRLEVVPATYEPRLWKVHIKMTDSLLDRYTAWQEKTKADSKATAKTKEYIAKLQKTVRDLKRKAK